jgi:hypothetical protein
MLSSSRPAPASACHSANATSERCRHYPHLSPRFAVGGAGCGANLPRGERREGRGRRRVAAVHLGFGRIVASKIKAPNIFVNLV